MQTTGKKLLDRVRDTIRLKHYSICTEQAYVKRMIFAAPWAKIRKKSL